MKKNGEVSKREENKAILKDLISMLLGPLPKHKPYITRGRKKKQLILLNITSKGRFRDDQRMIRHPPKANGRANTRSTLSGREDPMREDPLAQVTAKL